MTDSLTPQQMFNQVWDHFVVQKKPAGADFTTSPIQCRFSKGCAVGILVPPEDRKEMDRIGAINSLLLLTEMLREHKALSENTLAMLEQHPDFMRQLEQAHDLAVVTSIDYDGANDPQLPERFTRQMKYQLTELAISHSLKVPE